MTTQEMLTILTAAGISTEARTPSSTEGPQMRAWVCYREGYVCHIQIAAEEQWGETTVLRALTFVPMRYDWELAAL